MPTLELPNNVSAFPMEIDEVQVGTLDPPHASVGRAKEGDRDAFGDLYRQYHGPVFRLARAYLGEGAGDAVTETFLRAWRAIPSYRDTGRPFLAWLYGIARQVIAEEEGQRARAEPSPDLPDRQVNSVLTLAKAISRLPDEQRQVVELKFVMGATNAEAAATLGKSEGAVSAKQWKALAALLGMLEK